MDRRTGRALAGLLALVLVSGCGGAAPTPSTSAATAATPTTGAASFDTYATAFCAAWTSMFTAVGNLDTGGGSELSHALDAAVEAGDGVKAALLADQMDAELQAGRTQVAAAAAWPPATESMRHLDRLFVALQARTAARVPLALGAPDALDPQAVFEEAGGIDAWTAFLRSYTAMAPDRPAGTVPPCEGLPIGP